MPVKPDAAAALERAIAHAQGGELAAAEALLREVLAADPGAARASNALGVVLMQQQRLEEAEAALLRAGELAPADARAHVNLGKLYGAMKRPEKAEQHLRHAVRLDPRRPDAQYNLAAFLHGAGRCEEAEPFARLSIELDPRDSGAHYLLARLLLETGRFAAAESSFRDALRLEPGFAVAHCNLALVLLETGRIEEAQDACRAAIRSAPEFLLARSNYVMCGQYDPVASDGELLARARDAGAAVQAAAAGFAAPLGPARPSRDELRLGMVSGDLHRHPVGFFLLPLLRTLGGLGVRTTLYSNGSVADDISAQLATHADWVDIAEESDEQAWKRVRSDQQDVLIDLAGHTGKNRLTIFAARAAPLQVSWLGYFATTGTPNMDCVLMDPWHAPAGSDGQFTERVLRMPHSRFCFQPLAGAPAPAAAPPVAASGRITFGSFNSIGKLNDRVIRAWAEVLARVPESRLVLKWRTLADASCRDALAARFRAAGIVRERIELRPASDHLGLLAQYADIDIALDSFPFTGGQTSFEAMWMGVPVVTLAGQRPVSRQTLCVLGNIGLEDLAAQTEQGFVDRAVALARDADRLHELRATLRGRMQASPLMQPGDFAQAFVTLLREARRAVV